MSVMIVEVARDSDSQSRKTLNFILVPSERIVSKLMAAALFVTVCLQGFEDYSCM